MSRIGKKPIPIPQKVSVVIDGSSVSVKGPKGELSRTMPQGVEIAEDNGTVVVTRSNDSLTSRQTSWSLPNLRLPT